MVECLWGVHKVLVSVSSTIQSESGGACLKRKIETRVPGFQGHLCLYGDFKASLDYLRSLCGGGGVPHLCDGIPVTAGGNRFHTRSFKTFFCVPLEKKKMETSPCVYNIRFFF